MHASLNDSKTALSEVSASPVVLKNSSVSKLMDSLRIYQVNEPWKAPDFNISSLDGRKVRLSQYRGKFVILSFWTTW
jgi:cytochrome oxidase Cu insertion factor (SCO1/SenC/PrrC family)